MKMLCIEVRVSHEHTFYPVTERVPSLTKVCLSAIVHYPHMTKSTFRIGVAHGISYPLLCKPPSWTHGISSLQNIQTGSRYLRIPQCMVKSIPKHMFTCILYTCCAYESCVYVAIVPPVCLQASWASVKFSL